MKKLITLLLVLTGMVSTASATSGVVYVKASGIPHIYVWDSNGEIAGGWPGATMTETKVYGVTLYKYEFDYTADSYKVIFNWGQDNNESNTVSGLTGTSGLSWDGENKTNPSVYDYTIRQVELKGIFDDWNSDNPMTLENGVYSTTIDLTNSFDNQNFKIYLRNGSDDDAWFGWNDFNLTDNDNLLSGLDAKGSNFVIANRNKSYKTYNVSVSFPDPTESNMTFEGNAVRGSKSYTVTLNNNLGWMTPYIHAFVDGLGQTDWPGFDMETNDNGSTFTKTFTAYEPYPTKVIFSNNGSNETPALFLIDGHTYTNQYEAKYYVCGDVETFGDWDGTKTTALMSFVENGDQDYYTFSAEDILLTGNVNFKIIRKFYDEQVAPNGADWWPSNPQTITISESGKYNVTVIFNSYYQNWNDNGVASSTAALVSQMVPVIVSNSFGWATCVTTNAVDFSNVTDLKAYTATVANNTVTLAEAGKVPAGTALVLKATAAGTYYVPTVAEQVNEPSNDLKGSNEEGLTGLTENDNYYGLVVTNGTAQFTKITGNLAAGKAYLHLSTNARSLSVVFDEDATGISSVAVQNTNGEVYNLSGQRVAQPQKGLYIVNGKKVIMK